MNVVYFGHNANDAAVVRRVEMFLAGGARVTVIGFQRSKARVWFGAADFISLGQCYDGRLVHRIAAMARALWSSPRFRSELLAADVLVARNLDMLLIAYLTRAAFRARATLVYECLDVHRVMSAPGVIGRSLRAMEARLLRSCSLLLVSSPAFIENYFKPVQRSTTPVLVCENKVLRLGGPVAPPQRARVIKQGPPWRIGWFGIIRCRKSLEFLLALTARHPGLVEVVIRGRPVLSLFDDFLGAIAKHPGITYLGPYTAVDLKDIYADVHFTWAIDFYEEGLNSTWLLPNRLYEGTFFGGVAIACADVQTGKWLQQYNAGLLVSKMDDISRALHSMTMEEYRILAERALSVPNEALVLKDTDCRALIERLRTTKQVDAAQDVELLT